MNENIARGRLAAAPLDVQDRMMADQANLPPGTVSVVGRFFLTLAKRGESADAPSRGAFEQACANESALGSLLRALTKYAPEVCLAEGRALRKDYYRQRPGSPGQRKEGKSRKVEPPHSLVKDWPSEWLKLLPGLLEAPIKQSSVNRHIASINRCAAVLPLVTCPPRLGWLLGWEIANAIRDVAPGNRVPNDRTVASYISGLVSLAIHGGVEEKPLNGLRSVQASLQRNGRRLAKQKDHRLEDLFEKGGYAAATRAILRNLEEADALPDWTAEAANARATAAVLAVCLNDPARTGDVARWTFDEELVRHPTGHWDLRWRQQKTGSWKETGRLWPETGSVLDEHILGGRPARFVQRRYDELRGMNWLSFSDTAYERRWPSAKVRDAIGVPLHDLRTLAGDYLRLHDPASAPRILKVLLGHRSSEAGAEYSAICFDTAAQREWLDIRATHASGK